MKNDIDVTSNIASVSVQAAMKKGKKEPLAKLAAGNTMTHKVMGQDVNFKLVEVQAAKIEKKTMVWLANERVQELLDAHAVSDLMDSFKEQGQQVPAFGRDFHGLIEIADGSRRRYTALTTNKSFYIWVGDLTNQQMEYLSEIGNQYKETSAYEKGKRFERLLKNATQEVVAESWGMSRKNMMKYVNTAKLPEEFIKSFVSPNDLSARKGEALNKLFEPLADERKTEIINFCVSWLISEKGKHSADEIIELFTTKCVGTKQKPTGSPKKGARVLAENATVHVKNGTATFEIGKISDESLAEIEKAVRDILEKEILNNF